MQKYHQISIRYVISPFFIIFIRRMIPSKVLMQDKHTSIEKMHSRTLSVINWPPQIPDLYIIEAVCDHAERVCNKSQPPPGRALNVVKEAWRKIPTRKLALESSGQILTFKCIIML